MTEEVVIGLERSVDIETGEITERALTVRDDVLRPAHWDTLVAQATALVKSGFLPSAVRTPEAAIAIIMQGRELGIGPMASLQTINVIDGKPAISGQLMLALVERSGLCDDLRIEGDNKSCTVIMQRKGRAPHAETFSMEDAERLRLSTKDNWRKQPAVMLKWRAVSACARVVFPDLLLGIYTPEEMGDDGTIVEGAAWQFAPEPPKAPREPDVLDDILAGGFQSPPITVPVAETIDGEFIVKEEPRTEPSAPFDLDFLLK